MSLHSTDHKKIIIHYYVNFFYKSYHYVLYSLAENFQRFIYLTKHNTVASKHMQESQETTYPVSDTWLWTIGCNEQKHLSLLTCPYQFGYHEYIEIAKIYYTAQHLQNLFYVNVS